MILTTLVKYDILMFCLCTILIYCTTDIPIFFILIAIDISSCIVNYFWNFVYTNMKLETRLYFVVFMNRYIFYFLVSSIKLFFIDVIFGNITLLKYFISLVALPFFLNIISLKIGKFLFEMIEMEKVKYLTIYLTKIINYFLNSPYYTKTIIEKKNAEVNTDKQMDQSINSSGRRQNIVTSYISPTVGFQKPATTPPNIDLSSSK